MFVNPKLTLLLFLPRQMFELQNRFKGWGLLGRSLSSAFVNLTFVNLTFVIDSMPRPRLYHPLTGKSRIKVRKFTWCIMYTINLGKLVQRLQLFNKTSYNLKTYEDVSPSSYTNFQKYVSELSDTLQIGHFSLLCHRCGRHSIIIPNLFSLDSRSERGGDIHGNLYLCRL